MIEVLPIEGTCTAEALVDLLVAILTVAPTTTLAGGDVQAFRDWGINTNSGPFTPRITIDLPDEEKTGVGDIGPATFNTVAKITLHGFVSAVAAANPGGDGGEVRVRQAALQLRRQIEVAVINAPALMQSISEIIAVKTAFQSSSGDNGLHIIELVTQFAFRFYQGPEDFAQPDLEAVDELHLNIKPVCASGLDLPLDIPLT